MKPFIAAPDNLFNPSKASYDARGSKHLILVVGGETTAHDVRQRARCDNCRAKGNNTYQIVLGW